MVEVAAVEVEVMVVVEKQAVLDVLLLMILPVVVGEQVGGDGGGRLGEILGNNDDKIFPLIVLVVLLIINLKCMCMTMSEQNTT